MTKRLFIFAGYDAEGIVDKTLTYYLKTLSKLGDIVLTMDNELSETELKKITDIPNVLHASAVRHGEYDFGSYKRGYMWARDNKILEQYDWVYFVNDSVYLLASPQRMIDWLENTKHKMIGATENRTHKHHIQSWFMGFAPEIFLSDWFYGFLQHIRSEDKLHIVAHSEIGISKLVVDNGFSFGAYTSYLLTNRHYCGIEYNVPFLKKGIVTKDKKYAKKIKHVLNIASPDVLSAIQANAKRTKKLDIPFSKKSIFFTKLREVFWNKSLNGNYKVFGITVFRKDFYQKHDKYLYVLPLKIRIHKDRGGIIVFLNKFKLCHLHRKNQAATSKQIKRWNKMHAKANARGAVYTCITGDYDNLITHKYLNPDYDYICFTDNDKLINAGHPVWQFRPLPFVKGNNITNSRFPKLNPDKILREYDTSLYVDANVNIMSKNIFNVCEKSGQPILIPRHPDRDCMYEECNAVFQAKKDKDSSILNVYKLLCSTGYPRDMGLTENNIIWRHHNNSIVETVDTMWWDMFLKYSQRDQLSLGYVLWKNKIPFQDLYMKVQPNWDYVVVSHKK